MPSEGASAGSLEEQGAGLGSEGVLDLRPYALATSPEAASDYRVAAYYRELDGANLSCSVIPVAEVEGLLLVAVPHNTWHRLAARRYLPRQTLSKAVHTEVLAAEPGGSREGAWTFQGQALVGIFGGRGRRVLGLWRRGGVCGAGIRHLWERTTDFSLTALRLPQLLAICLRFSRRRKSCQSPPGPRRRRPT